MFISVFEWLKGLTVFVIVCETTLGFAPSLQYKRYLKPFVGFVILLRIIGFWLSDNTYEMKLDIDELFVEQEISFGNILKENKLNEDIINNIEAFGQDKMEQEMRIQIEDISLTPIEVGKAE